MCLILLSWQPKELQRLVILANRDEFFDRPTLQADFWHDMPDILAGRDKKAGGTWLGVDKRGRFAAITNYRSPLDMNAGGTSRGSLPVKFLGSEETAMSYLDQVSKQKADYAGFNLLVFDGNDLCYYSNRSDKNPVALSPGVYGLSNSLLNTSWPKVDTGRSELRNRIDTSYEPSPDWLDIMADSSQAADKELPDTGVGYDLEKRLSARCIVMEGYGTRSSTFVSIGQTESAQIQFVEKTIVPAGLNPDTVSFRLV